MQFPAFTKNEAVVLALLAAFGFFVPNGVFVYFVFQNPALVRGALANPLALVFVLEAFFLMFVVAWLLARAGVRKPSALGFVLMSLAGSLAFSVPASLWLAAKKSGRE